MAWHATSIDAALARLPWPQRALALGWWVFLAAFFVAPDKHALRISFYALVAVPALLCARVLIKGASWRDPLSLSIAASLLFLCASALWGDDAAGDHAVRAMKIMVVLFICFLVPGFLSRAAALTGRHLIVAIVALSCLIAAINLLANLIAVISGAEPLHRYTRLAGYGQYDNPLQYAGLLGCSALLALCEFFRETRRSRQAWLLAALALLVVSLLLTMSRGPIVYFIGVAMLVALLNPARWRRSLLLATLAAASALPVLLHPAGRVLVEANISRPAYRPAIWSAVIEETRGKELFGQGWRDDQSIHIASTRFGHPHNFLLAIYRFGGLIGLTLFLLMTALLFYRCTRLEPHIGLPLGAWLLYGVALHLTNGRFIVSAPGNDWFFYWLPAALIYGFDRAAVRRQSVGE